MQDLICICEQETFTCFINKFRLNKALPVKTAKLNFAAFFLFFGNSFFVYL